jgi:hypothetical protein
MFDHERGTGELPTPAAALRLAVDPRSLAEISWDELEPAAAMELVTALRRVTMSVDAALATGMASIARTQVAESSCGLSAGTWWANSRLGCASQGAWLARAGELIDRFPRLGAALRRGELGLEHLRAIDEIQDRRVLRELESLDEELSREAVLLTLAGWRRHMRARVALLHEELDRQAEADRRTTEDAEPTEDAGPGPLLEEPPVPDPRAGGGDHGEGPNDGQSAPDLFDSLLDDRDAPHGPDVGWFSMRPTSDGGLLLRGQLLGSAAESFRQALLAETSRHRRIAWREHDNAGIAMPSGGQLQAQALLQLVHQGLATPTDTSIPARTEAIVVIPVSDEGVGAVRALDGEPLTPEVAALLRCDAHLRAIVVDHHGSPLWLGRSTRLASPAQRKALAIRDGGCTFPGCDMRADWCDAHHQPGWETGGRTDVDAMVLLCRRHHGAAHSRRWTLRPAAPPPTPPAEHPADGSSNGSVGQRFEWHDSRTRRTIPAQQRGLTDSVP